MYQITLSKAIQLRSQSLLVFAMFQRETLQSLRTDFECCPSLLADDVCSPAIMHALEQ